MEGLVIKSTGSWYDVLTEDDQIHACRVRGKIRLEGIKETNPIAVGDRVIFETHQNTITQIVERKNHILRQSVKKTGHTHVLAANVDQAMLIVTLAFPRTSLGFIDRFLVAAESFRIPQLIVFNKQDLYEPTDQQKVDSLCTIYESIGVSCLITSAIQDDLTELKNRLQHNVTLMAGHSGVGKSTLINSISAHIKQKVSNVSASSEKGVHTTTFAEMFRLNTDTFIIDTPGIKEWGLADVTPEELSDYFPEMRARRENCKFGSRCIHIHEPKCAVIQAVEAGEIALSRYESYLSMALGEDNRK